MRDERAPEPLHIKATDWIIISLVSILFVLFMTYSSKVAMDLHKEVAECRDAK